MTGQVMVRLMGGLGNQLFQYAAGRALAVRHAAPLKFDLSWFQPGSLRRFCLAEFELNLQFTNRFELLGLLGSHRPWLNSLLKAFSLGRYPNYRVTRLEDEPGTLSNRFFSLEPPIYLEGYWQSEAYFIQIAPILQRELTFSQPLAGECDIWARQIQAGPSASLHIRRGDYISNLTTHDFHGVCELEYYQASVAELVRRRGQPVNFFVFSDDIAWAQENLHLEAPLHFVSDLAIRESCRNEVEELRLMSLCQDHIIANSSFSWWGAWLNPRPDKIVIAPRRWFRQEGIATDQIVPDGWIRL